MKSQIQTTLLGRIVTTKQIDEANRCITGGRSTAIFRIEALWISDNDPEPSVALVPVNRMVTAAHTYLNDAPGPIIIDFLSNLVIV